MSVLHVVVTDDRYGQYEEEAGVLGEIGAKLTVHAYETPEKLVAAAREADALIANLAPLPAEAIGALTRCRVISRYGVGVDNVDVEAATRRGIWVANVPDYCGEDVSDHTIALMLGAMRGLARVDRGVREGGWNLSQTRPVFRLRGKVWGFVGFGQIARAVARKLGGFALGELVAFDPFMDESATAAAGARKVELAELLAASDFISVHAPLSAQTRGLIGAAEIARMKPTAVLVNVSRGPVVDEAAVAGALAEGRILAAGLDVFAAEPPAADSPLKALDRALLTDHAGWYTVESLAELKTKAAVNVREVLAGREPPYPVNRPATGARPG